MGTIVLSRDGKPIGAYDLGERPVLVGSDQDCQICLAEPSVSARIAAFVEKNGVAALKDLGASGAIFVNDQAVRHSSMIQDGDRIRIDPFLMIYRAQAATGQTAPDATHPAGVSSPPASAAKAMPNDSTILQGPSIDEADAGDDYNPEEDDEEAMLANAATQDTGDTSVQIGEFYEADGSEDVDFGGSTGEGLTRIDVTESMMNVIRARLSLYSELDQLDAERTKLLEDESLPEAVKSEYRRQLREAQELPPGERAADNIEKVKAKIAKMEEAAAAKEGEPVNPRLRQAYGMAVHQWEMLVQNDERMPDILAAAKPFMEKEPLYWVLSEAKIDVRELFGLAIYVLALEAVSAQQNARRKQLRDERSRSTETSKGMLGMFRRNTEEQDQKALELRKSEEQSAAIVTWVGRETRRLERRMVETYWKTYEAAVNLLISRDFGKQEETQIRAFLRYGLLGCHPYFMPPDKTRQILQDSGQWRTEWDYSMDATHVLYADEYIGFVAKGACTPSIDEDLELNRRNSPEWKADKAWRRLIHTRVRETALRELRATLEERVKVLREQQADAELRRDKLIRGAKDYKKMHREVSQKIQHHRVEAARFERAIARIDEVYMTALMQQREGAREKLAAAGVKLSARELLKREVHGIRRVTRLTANLKEPFPPFALRDNYKPGTDALNDRPAMLEEVAELEKRDPIIFKEPLMPVKKKSHRLYMRFCPIILLTPGCGFLGYSWNPRAGSEPGRLAIPLYSPRPRLRERLLQNMFADFRWDTSKASAGVDLLTSDTLVAAYSTVRWEYRKKSRETREKAAIFNEDNDRKNWRRHYALYLASAMDGGKKLFFKCLEAYEQVILKYLDLPDGVERLRR